MANPYNVASGTHRPIYDYTNYIPPTRENMAIVNGTAEKVSNLDCCEFLGKWKLTAMTGGTSFFSFAVIIICAINGCFSDTCNDLCSDPGKITMFVLGFLAFCFTFGAWGHEKSKNERKNEHLFQAI